MIDLNALYAELQELDAGAADAAPLRATAIPGGAGHRIARASRGGPTILIKTSDGSSVWPPPMRLANLHIGHNVRCRMWVGDRIVEEGAFTLVGCDADDPDVRALFLRVGGPLIASLGHAPQAAEVAHSLQAIIELFRGLAGPPTKTVQGLWAEVLVLARGSDCAEMVKAWHVSPLERYDLANGEHRLEVKCALGRQRSHHFALDQVSPPPGLRVLVVSICTEPSGGGKSLGALCDEVRQRLAETPELQLRFDRIVALTLGRDLFEGLRESFDLELAEASLRFLDANDVPRPPGTMPSEVSQVRFVADVENITPYVFPPAMEPASLFANARGHR